MTFTDDQDDELTAAIAALRTYDVSERRADRLRTRCHGLLQAQPRPTAPRGIPTGALLRRVIGPALGAAWSLAYLVEIIRRAAAVYRS